MATVAPSHRASWDRETNIDNNNNNNNTKKKKYGRSGANRDGLSDEEEGLVVESSSTSVIPTLVEDKNDSNDTLSLAGTKVAMHKSEHSWTSTASPQPVVTSYRQQQLQRQEHEKHNPRKYSSHSSSYSRENQRDQHPRQQQQQHHSQHRRFSSTKSTSSPAPFHRQRNPLPRTQQQLTSRRSDLEQGRRTEERPVHHQPKSYARTQREQQGSYTHHASRFDRRSPSETNTASPPQDNPHHHHHYHNQGRNNHNNRQYREEYPTNGGQRRSSSYQPPLPQGRRERLESRPTPEKPQDHLLQQQEQQQQHQRYHGMEGSFRGPQRRRSFNENNEYSEHRPHSHSQLQDSKRMDQQQQHEHRDYHRSGSYRENSERAERSSLDSVPPRQSRPSYEQEDAEYQPQHHHQQQERHYHRLGSRDGSARMEQQHRRYNRERSDRSYVSHLQQQEHSSFALERQEHHNQHDRSREYHRRQPEREHSYHQHPQGTTRRDAYMPPSPSRREHPDSNRDAYSNNDNAGRTSRTYHSASARERDDYPSFQQRQSSYRADLDHTVDSSYNRQQRQAPRHQRSTFASMDSSMRKRFSPPPKPQDESTVVQRQSAGWEQQDLAERRNRPFEEMSRVDRAELVPPQTKSYSHHDSQSKEELEASGGGKASSDSNTTMTDPSNPNKKSTMGIAMKWIKQPNASDKVKRERKSMATTVRSESESPSKMKDVGTSQPPSSPVVTAGSVTDRLVSDSEGGSTVSNNRDLLSTMIVAERKKQQQQDVVMHIDDSAESETEFLLPGDEIVDGARIRLTDDSSSVSSDGTGEFGNSSDDSDTDDEEVMEWASKMFGLSQKHPQIAKKEDDDRSVDRITNGAEAPLSTVDSQNDSQPMSIAGDKSRKRKKQQNVHRRKKTKKARMESETTTSLSSKTDHQPVKLAVRGRKKAKKAIRKPVEIAPEEREIDEEKDRLEREEERRIREEAKPLTAAQIRAILGEDDFQGASSNWVRRSVRQPNRALVNSKPLKALVAGLKMNSPEMVVLKMKKYVNDPNAPSVVIDAALDALEENTNCEVLYIQNFNEGMRDRQVLHLLRILQSPSCKIWCMNIGENYNVGTRTWDKFTKGLSRTKITHMYASEHTITTQMKDEIRKTIRENRQKHDLHINPNNLDVIIQCTHCWWNPINAKALRPYLKKKGYEHILNDKEVQGLRGSTSAAPTGV